VSTPRPTYPMEFRTEAVRLASAPGNTISGVAADLGISRHSLARWAREAEVAGDGNRGQHTEEWAEVVRLRRRVAVLEEEREILVKAAAFFAKETGGTR
jgi:transposase